MKGESRDVWNIVILFAGGVLLAIIALHLLTSLIRPAPKPKAPKSSKIVAGPYKPGKRPESCQFM